MTSRSSIVRRVTLIAASLAGAAALTVGVVASSPQPSAAPTPEVTQEATDVAQTILTELGSSWPTLPPATRTRICADFDTDQETTVNSLTAEYVTAYEQRTGLTASDEIFAAVVAGGYFEFLTQECTATD